nr:hypothetical protein [uncultured Campylobacter sp.]
MKQITKFPQPPTTSEPQNFDERADAFVGALPKFVTETNEVAAEAEQTLQTVQTLKEDADASKQAAQTSAQTASEAKEAAARSASEAESSAQTAEQIKTQTQEIKQSAQEALAAIAAAAQSSAQAAKQSEQAAEQTKTELQTATNTLEQMKSIVKDGFIDDGTQSETKTYSSKKISELSETLKTDVTQEIKRVDESVRADAIKGNLNLPTAYESDLAMWDYMEHSPASLSSKARFFKDWALGAGEAVRGYTIYPGLDRKIKNNYYVSPSEKITAILDGSGEVIAAIADNGVIYKQDGTMTYLNTSNSDGVIIDASFKKISVAGKFVLYWLTGDGVAVFGLSGDDKVLKYLYKTSVADVYNGYVFHDVLVINKDQAPQKTYKITNTGISEITGVELPKAIPQYRYDAFYMPFYKDFLPSKNALIKADGTVKSIRICGEILGFLGGTPYLLQRITPLSGVHYSTNAYLYAVYDVESGSRCVLLPLGKEPITAYIEDGYAYILFKDGVTKIPAKYLTGANYKGE